MRIHHHLDKVILVTDPDFVMQRSEDWKIYYSEKLKITQEGMTMSHDIIWRYDEKVNI